LRPLHQLTTIWLIIAAAPAASATPPESSRAVDRPDVTQQTDYRTEPERDPREGFDASLDVGAGVAEFLHADLGLLFSRRFTAGLGFGFLPIDALLENAIGADDIEAAEAAAGVDAFDDPKITMFSFLGALRLYPLKGAFFLEAAFEAWRFEATLMGSYTPPGASAPLDLTADATTWTTMIGAHTGWRFLTKSGFFVELLLGLQFVLGTTSDIELSGSAVAEAERSPETASVLRQTRGYLEDQLEGKAGGLLARQRVLPTGALRLGFAFDLNGG